MGIYVSCILDIGLDIFSMKRKYEYLAKINKWKPQTKEEHRNENDIAYENYTIKKLLGTGKYGTVYLCQNNKCAL